MAAAKQISKIPKEVAEAEIDKWLDYKKVRPSKRDDKKANIQTLVWAVMDGDLVLGEDFALTQKLLYPISNEISIAEIKYKARLDTKTISSYINGSLKQGDFLAMFLPYMCALTGQPKAIIQALDTEDYEIAQSIAIFFMSV